MALVRRELRLRAGFSPGLITPRPFPMPSASHIAVAQVKESQGWGVGQFRQRELLPRLGEGKRMGCPENPAQLLGQAGRAHAKECQTKGKRNDKVGRDPTTKPFVPCPGVWWTWPGSDGELLRCFGQGSGRIRFAPGPSSSQH